MTFWLVLVVLLMLALWSLVWPLLRHGNGLSPLIAGIILFVVGSSVGLYHYLGSPGVPSGASAAPEVEEMVAALAARLENNPDDVNGWTMLARSYATMQRHEDAVMAYERVVELDQGRSAQSLVALANALMARDSGAISDRAAGLFENALAIEPNNVNALFYAGGAAAQRGNTDLAAERWELLLQLDAPPRVRELLESKINEWRGVTSPQPAPAESAATLRVNVSVSDKVTAAIPQDATVFIIARDPAQPSPPIAVVRRQYSELPTDIVLTDRNAMLPGRLLSNFSEVELVARVSMSGSPAAQSGDWYQSALVELADSAPTALVIDTVIP